MNYYIRHTLCALLVLIAVIVSFNIWADPYNLYRFKSANAERMSRIDQGLSMRLSKPWQVRQLRPDTALIGSSRSGSIKPHHQRWGAMRSFNLSMAGLTLYEMLLSIQHAQDNGPLNELIIGLDYETFISGDYQAGLGFSAARLAGAGHPGFYRQALRDFLDTTFTSSALSRSLSAIKRRTPITTWYYPDGSWDNRSRAWRGEAGYVSVGRNMRRLAAGDSETFAANMAFFSGILDYCHQQGIAVTLFISPEHIFLTELRNTLGSSEQWILFHHELARINEQRAQANARPPYPLLGFNDLAGIVDEPLPRGDSSPEAWFRDGIHFRNELGSLLLNRILDADYGRSHSLSSANMNQYLAPVEALRKSFVASNSKDIARYRRKIL